MMHRIGVVILALFISRKSQRRAESSTMSKCILKQDSLDLTQGFPALEVGQCLTAISSGSSQDKSQLDNNNSGDGNRRNDKQPHFRPT